MVNSILLQLLGSLSVSEFKDFGEYIHCQYFNRNESVVKLYEYLKLYHPDFSKMNFEKETVYKKLFQNAAYDDGFMRKLMFNLSKLAEDYLAFKHFSKNEFTYYNGLLLELNKRGLDRLLQKKLNLMQEEFNKRKIKDLEYYEVRQKIFEFRNLIYLKGMSFLNVKDKPDETLIKEIEALIDFFLLSIIEKYKFLFNFKKMIKYEFESESEFYKDIISYLKKNESLHKIPLLSLYLNSLLLIIEKKEIYFEKLKAVLQNEMNALSYEDKYASFAVLINHSNDEYYKGNRKYLNKRHELHKLVLENNLIAGLKQDEYFNDILFKNIVSVGLLMKEINWTEDFIRNNIDKIYPEERSNVLNLNTARLNFEKGNFDESLENLSKISTVQHFHYKTSIKALTLMIYIEKGWLAEASDVIDAFRHFLSNDKMLPSFQKEKNLNFLKFCNELIKVISSKSKKKSVELKHNLINTENVLEKEWLMQKFI